LSQLCGGKHITLREPGEQAQEQQERDHRQHPPLFLLPQKLKILGDDLQLFTNPDMVSSCTHS
jgi:hypothetical protein